MQKENIAITTECITMDKLLKFSGVADTGGQAFLMVEDGIIKLNGKLVKEKRKKRQYKNTARRILSWI